MSIEEEPQGFAVRGGVFGLGLRDRVVIASTSSGVISTEVLGRPHAWRQDHARALGESAWRRLRIEETSLRWTPSKSPALEPHRRGALWRGATPRRLSWIYYSAMIRSPRRISIEFAASDKDPAGELRLLLHGETSAGKTRVLRVRSGAEAPVWGNAAAQSTGTSSRQRFAIGLASIEQAKHPAARFLVGAQLGNGSRIWSDARGFLHFASPDASLGQLTLVLYAEPPFTAWCSLGWKLDASAPLRLKPGQVHPIADWLLRFLAPLTAAPSLGGQL